MKFDPTKPHCGNCEYFTQHYAWNEKRFLPIFLGHCRPEKRFRNRHPTDKPCEFWTPQSEAYKAKQPDISKLMVRPEQEYCIRILVFPEDEETREILHDAFISSP